MAVTNLQVLDIIKVMEAKASLKRICEEKNKEEKKKKNKE